ncbi:MAG: hypothetical protein J6B85_09060 [Lachnospiraceae bacterium]|nr:hypothetical protein [Lachnospiraceae bacterium]
MKQGKKKCVIYALMCAAAVALVPLAVPGAERRVDAKCAQTEGKEIWDGMFCFQPDDSGEGLIWIGCWPEERESTGSGTGEQNQQTTVLRVPEQVTADGTTYPVTGISISWRSYDTQERKAFCDGIREIMIPKSVIGDVENLTTAFQNLEYIEFLGAVPPAQTEIEPGPVVIVPEGSEDAYRNAIQCVYYYGPSDLAEKDVVLTPDVAASREDKIEKNFFVQDGLLYQVTEKAGESADTVGCVSLIGISEKQESYLQLAGELEYEGYRYRLTKLTKFSLYHCGARIIVLPDTITEMESAVFGGRVEMLFLSAGCPVIPRNLASDEADLSLRYVYVPDGVTTISDNAFWGYGEEKRSIRLPDTIQYIGTRAINGFEVIRDKAEEEAESGASETGSGIGGDDEASENKGSSRALLLSAGEVKVGMLEEKHLTASVAEGKAAEEIRWVSTDTDIFEISDDGFINPKKAGTAYAFAYTEGSGQFGAVTVHIRDKRIGQGMFVYRINNAAERTVSIIRISPKASTEIIRIPETVTFYGKEYTVTSVVRDESMERPVLEGTYAKNNRIRTIIFPKSVTGKVGYLGELPCIETIIFEGEQAPDSVEGWMNDGGTLAHQAEILVPEESIKQYRSAIWYGDYDRDRYGEKLKYQIKANESESE